MTNIRILRLSDRFQRGRGWGNVFGRIASFLRPLLSSALRAGKPVAQKALKRIANESIKTGANIISDIAEGQDVKEAIRQRAKEGVKAGKDIVLDEVRKGINSQRGGKRKHKLQGGGQRGRKKIKKNNRILKPAPGIFF